MSTKLTCKFCKEQFDQPKSLYEHLQSQHSAPKGNLTCPICGVLCSKYAAYRDHLLYIHGQCNEGQKLTFRTLNEFLQWKASLEIKYDCNYILQSAPKILSNNDKMYFYYCDRASSGVKDKKSVTVKKTCSSVITVVEGTGVFKVEYWDTHSGHNQTSVPIHKDELDNAISSVEMVHAIAESDDSFDKTEQYVVSENNGLMSELTSEKNQSSIIVNFDSSVSSPSENSKCMQEVKKSDTSKKRSSLFSLASVACGKGITKKSLNKSNSLKNSTDKVLSKSKNPNPVSDKSEDQKNQLMCLASAATTVTSLSSTSLVSSLATKIAASHPPLAPKISTNSGNAVNLLTSQNNFANQLVFVNPVTISQNTVNSNQNVFTAGQNILLTLGPVGQNMIPTSGNVPKPTDSVCITNDKNTAANPTSVAKTAENLSSASSVKAGTHIVSSISSTAAISTTSNSISLAPGMSNAPVILSSLPVGSTFMSVNNNLIPIATPSGTFLPTNLPPNIVLAPVVPGPVAPSRTPVPRMPLSSAGNTTLLQSHSRLNSPNTVAITVSSVVKEPLYTTSVSKTVTTVTSAASSLISSPSTKKSQSDPESKHDVVLTQTKCTSSKIPAGKRSSSNKSSPQSTRKRAVRNSLKTPAKVLANISSKEDSSPVTHMATPICSTSVSTPTAHKPGTLVFESSGDVYMLEPVENEVIGTSLVKLKSELQSSPMKIKTDRSVQTVENLGSSNLRIGRKRTSDDGDTSVLLKVKYYQLEMKYLSSQTECKQLKLDLTKEKLKNAELTGEKVDIESNLRNSDSGMNKAQEIMKEIEDRFSENKDEHIYTLTKTSVLRSLYDDLENLCMENKQLHEELDCYRTHDKFYKTLKKRLDDEDF